MQVLRPVGAFPPPRQSRALVRPAIHANRRADGVALPLFAFAQMQAPERRSGARLLRTSSESAAQLDRVTPCVGTAYARVRLGTRRSSNTAAIARRETEQRRRLRTVRLFDAMGTSAWVVRLLPPRRGALGSRDLDLSAGHRSRGDHRDRPRSPATDDPRKRRPGPAPAAGDRRAEIAAFGSRAAAARPRAVA
jgi:hypothetical protein